MRPRLPTAVFRRFATKTSLGHVGDGRTYDVSPDGKGFLMIKPGGGPEQTAAPPSLIVVQNWFEGLKRLVPVRHSWF